MEQFKGVRMFADSVGSAFNNPRLFWGLTGSWAVLTTAVTILFCWIAKPAGASASFADQLLTLSKSGSGGSLIRLVPTIFANLAISVGWIKFVLLGATWQNPLKLTHEMGNYFIKSIVVGLAVMATLVPGFIVAFALKAVAPAPAGVILLTLAIVVLAIIPALVVLARLSMVLVAIAMDEDMSFSRAFEMTKGRSASLATGLFLSYAVPNVILFAAAFVCGIIIGTGLRFVGGLSLELITNLGTGVTAAIAAGFIALTYKTLAPGDIGGNIAKQFE